MPNGFSKVHLHFVCTIELCWQSPMHDQAYVQKFLYSHSAQYSPGWPMPKQECRQFLEVVNLESSWEEKAEAVAALATRVF